MSYQEISSDLNESEQYRNQMAGISTAALGYWKEGDSIHADYDTLALRDVAKLYMKYERAHEAMRAAMDEIGVPQAGCPTPVQSAFDHLHRAFYADIECIIGQNEYRPAPIQESVVNVEVRK